MKRYTGQKALYEAISRSRAKAKRSNILERLLPEVTGQEQSAAAEEQSQVEPLSAASETPAVANEQPQPAPVPERSRDLEALRESLRLKRLAKAGSAAETPVPPDVRPVSALSAGSGLGAGQSVWVQRIRTWWRLKPVQVNAGRIEISAPYQVGIVVGLVLLLVILAAFRMGQKRAGAKAEVPVATSATMNAKTPAAASTAAPAAESPAAQGDNWLVLAQYKQKADLDEVKAYFGRNGIDLRVVYLPTLRQVFAEEKYDASVLPRGDGYLLVTNGLYNNPNSPGSEGYKLRQKVVALGKGYKAPSGRESFAPKSFGDAYWMKIGHAAQ